MTRHRRRTKHSGPTVNERLTLALRQGIVDGTIAIRDSARKHGVADDAIRHAITHPMRVVMHEYDDERRLLIIGGDTGELLEVVAVAGGSGFVLIHADVLRPKYYDFL